MLFKALGIIEIEIDATMESGEARSLQKTSLFGSLDCPFHFTSPITLHKHVHLHEMQGTLATADESTRCNRWMMTLLSSPSSASMICPRDKSEPKGVESRMGSLSIHTSYRAA